MSALNYVTQEWTVQSTEFSRPESAGAGYWRSLQSLERMGAGLPGGAVDKDLPAHQDRFRSHMPWSD